MKYHLQLTFKNNMGCMEKKRIFNYIKMYTFNGKASVSNRVMIKFNSTKYSCAIVISVSLLYCEWNLLRQLWRERSWQQGKCTSGELCIKVTAAPFKFYVTPHPPHTPLNFTTQFYLFGEWYFAEIVTLNLFTSYVTATTGYKRKVTWCQHQRQKSIFYFIDSSVAA